MGKLPSSLMRTTVLPQDELFPCWTLSIPLALSTGQNVNIAQHIP